MLTTEDEAKTKRCHASYGDGWQTHDGRMAVAVPTITTAVASPSHCIGSACMAWRWAFTANVITGVEQTKHGYCGLAGDATGVIE